MTTVRSAAGDGAARADQAAQATAAVMIALRTLRSSDPPAAHGEDEVGARARSLRRPGVAVRAVAAADEAGRPGLEVADEDAAGAVALLGREVVGVRRERDVPPVPRDGRPAARARRRRPERAAAAADELGGAR